MGRPRHRSLLLLLVVRMVVVGLVVLLLLLLRIILVRNGLLPLTGTLLPRMPASKGRFRIPAAVGLRRL